MIKKIWLVTQESNVGGDILFNVVPCISKEVAKKVMQEEIETILDESLKYKDARRWMAGDDDTLDYDECPFVWENENPDSWYLKIMYDDYYESINIEEKEILC